MKGVGEHYHHNGICTAYGGCIRPAILDIEGSGTTHFCHVHEALLPPNVVRRLKALFDIGTHRMSGKQSPEFEVELARARRLLEESDALSRD